MKKPESPRYFNAGRCRWCNARLQHGASYRCSFVVCKMLENAYTNTPERPEPVTHDTPEWEPSVRWDIHKKRNHIPE